MTKAERNNIILFLSCMFAYIVISFARSNYAASIAYIVQEKIFTKPQSGLISSAFWVLYGIGVLFGGRLVDKFSPYKLIGVGVFATMLSNIIIAFTKQYYVVLVVWSICGLVQFGVWPGIVKILATDIFPEFRQRGSFHISYASTLGNIFSYLCAILLLDKFGWSVMFGSSAVMLLITLIIWIFTSRIAPVKKTEELYTPASIEENIPANKPEQGMWSVFLRSGFVLTLPISLLICMLSTGTQVWIPTMIMESYEISPVWANVQSIILSVVCMVALWVFMPLLKKLKNEITAKNLFFILALIPLLVLPFIGKIPMWSAVTMLILFQMTVAFSGAYSTGMLGRFAPYGYSGTAAGLTSAISSLGDVFAGLGYGLIAEYFGWSGVTIVWLILTGLIILGYTITNIFWTRFFKLK